MSLLEIYFIQFLPHIGILFSPMVSGWAVGRAGWWAAGRSLSDLYLGNRKV